MKSSVYAHRPLVLGFPESACSVGEHTGYCPKEVWRALAVLGALFDKAKSGDELSATLATEVSLEVVNWWQKLADMAGGVGPQRDAIAKVLKGMPVIPALWDPRKSASAAIEKRWGDFKVALDYPLAVTKKSRSRSQTARLVEELMDYAALCGQDAKVVKILESHPHTKKGYILPDWFLKASELELFGGCDSWRLWWEVMSGALLHFYPDPASEKRLASILPDSMRRKSKAARRKEILNRLRRQTKRMAGE